MEQLTRPPTLDSISGAMRRIPAALKRLASANIFFLILVVIVIVLSLLSPHFLTRNNLLNVARQAAYIGIIAVGMTIVILTSGIDLSVGSVLALTACLFAGLMAKSGWSSPLAAVAAIGAGALLGLLSGACIAYLRVPAFIATLGMMGIARGLAKVYTAGAIISGIPREWDFFGVGNILGIPTPVVIWFVIVFLAWLALSRMTFGRYIYAIGNSAPTARLSGVNVRFYTVLPYVISGVCSAVSGILLTARLSSAQPVYGTGYELDAIAAVVLGGTSFLGGRGSVVSTVLGTLLMSILRNGMNLLGVSSWWQYSILGALLIVAIAISMTQERD
jgi:ribose transport system permease protein